METHAIGTFDVALATIGTDDHADGATVGRTSIDKSFRGDLQGTSKGEMISAITEVEGSAGYVAIERVTGTLHGRRGSFVLQHGGVMNRGFQQLTILVVPDSGSGELAGLSGRMALVISDGVHSYDFQYSLPDGSR